MTDQEIEKLCQEWWECEHMEDWRITQLVDATLALLKRAQRAEAMLLECVEPVSYYAVIECDERMRSLNTRIHNLLGLDNPQIESWRLCPKCGGADHLHSDGCPVGLSMGT